MKTSKRYNNFKQKQLQYLFDFGKALVDVVNNYKVKDVKDLTVVGFFDTHLAMTMAKIKGIEITLDALEDTKLEIPEELKFYYKQIEDMLVVDSEGNLTGVDGQTVEELVETLRKNQNG